MMLESKRASRGKRMTSLVGKAAEDDEAFWGNDVWNEDGSDAESFVDEEGDKPDEFDTDFDESETEEESDSEEEKEATRGRKKQVPIIGSHYSVVGMSLFIILDDRIKKLQQTITGNPSPKRKDHVLKMEKTTMKQRWMWMKASVQPKRNLDKSIACSL